MGRQVQVCYLKEQTHGLATRLQVAFGCARNGKQACHAEHTTKSTRCLRAVVKGCSALSSKSGMLHCQHVPAPTP